MEKDYIFVKGAKEHNLKSIDIRLPRNKLIVITGLSGSGKSSLAFDTIYAEGQRRYVESLSAYARQFLEQLQKPDVEYIEGLSPAIAIQQRAAARNPRSTVGTQTEIYDYLRLLFARIGEPYCYKCGRKIKQQTAQEIVERILEIPPQTPIMILAPVVRGRKGEYTGLFREIQKEGFVRVRIDKGLYELPQQIRLDKMKRHDIEVVIDRLSVNTASKKRLTDSVEVGLKVGKGLVIVNVPKKGTEYIYSEVYACTNCGINYTELQPRAFSFNSPYGACPECNGLGMKLEIDPDLVIPDKKKSINENAIEPWRRGGRGYIMHYHWLLRELARELEFSLDTPFKDLNQHIKKAILYGTDQIVGYKSFEGVIPHLERLFNETESDYMKSEITKYMSELPCPKCRGARLKQESLAVRICDRSIADVSALSVLDAKNFFEKLKLSERQKMIAHHILKEINSRLQFLKNVGLDYLTLDRASATLSGGESQRIHLATQIGAGLVGVLYILDEPSIGLHQRDNRKLLGTLKALRDLGNTLIVVEHDETTIRSADHIVDLGPGAGKHGGRVVVSGTLKDILNSPNSLTGRYLEGRFKIPVPKRRRPFNKNKVLKVSGAAEHNLKKIDVEIPLGLFVCITGVSGSGKSTFVDEILYRALARRLYKSTTKPGRYDKIIGAEMIDKVIVIDQSPIGRTPRSNPATYTGVFSYIRELFSKLPESRIRGFKPGRFSFNVKGGRCETCQGDGMIKVEMHFLPDVYVTCEVCKGRRFNEQTLEVTYKGRSIADVLEMSIEENLILFENIPKIKDKLKTISDVGLGYIELGQSATTLSGGEAQRVSCPPSCQKGQPAGRSIYWMSLRQACISLI